jgi:hypothetical protein
VSAQPPPSPRALVAVVILVPAVVALALWAFTWPAARTAPNELPLGVAGPASATGQVAEQLAQQDGAFDVHTYPDEAGARAAIEDREVYGAILLTGPAADGPELLTASAAGPVVAGVLEEVAAHLVPDGGELAVTDVVPLPEGDPRGSVFNSSVLPLALAGIATGVVVTLTGLPRRPGSAIVAIAGASAVVGVAGAAIGYSWLEALDGSWWNVAATIALVVLACAASVAGLAALFGPPGIGLGAVAVMLMGNPWSGATSAPEMLPDPVGMIGQWLPLGAGATLLRSVSFFDGAAAGFPLLVLGLWTLLGVAAIAIGGRRQSAARRTQSGFT